MHARSSRCSHDATTKILRKSIDASEAIRASSRRLGAAAFDFCVLHHHIELLSAPSPPPMQHNSGGIMLHQGELWESGHVTEEEEEEENIEYSSPLSLSLFSPTGQGKATPSELTAVPAGPSPSSSSSDNPIDFLSGKLAAASSIGWRVGHTAPISHECEQ